MASKLFLIEDKNFTKTFCTINFQAILRLRKIVRTSALL